MSDFDKRFDRALDIKFPLAELVYASDFSRQQRKGINWTRPALKAAYEALDYAQEFIGDGCIGEPENALIEISKALKEIEKLLEQD